MTESISETSKHGQNFNDTAKLLINYATASIGQKSIDPIIAKIGVEIVSDEIKRHYQKKDASFFKEAIKYGAKKNDISSISGSVITRWLEQYHKEVWLPKNKHKIHNQPENKLIAPKEITPQETILNNYRSWKRGLIGYSFVRVFQALDDLGLKNDLWDNTVAWKFIFKAANEMKDKANQSQLFKEFRNIEAKIKRIKKGDISTVSGDIIAEAKRLMVKKLFENSSEHEIKMLIE